MSTEPNAEREAMIERAWQAFKPHGWDDDRDCSFFGDSVLQIAADFALTETATLRQQLATAREALEKIVKTQPVHAFDSEPRSANIAREALAKMEEVDKSVRTAKGTS